MNVIEIEHPKLVLRNGKSVRAGTDTNGRPTFLTEPGTAFAIEGLDGWIFARPEDAAKAMEEIREEATRSPRGVRKGSRRSELRDAARMLGFLR